MSEKSLPARIGLGIDIGGTGTKAALVDLETGRLVGRREAEICACSLVGANLRGYDSHGVMRIPFYVAAIRDGFCENEQQRSADCMEAKMKPQKP